jgi:TolB protein
LNDPGIAREWKNVNALYVVKIQIREKQLEASLLSVSANSLKTFEGFSLSGELSQDRQQLHQLADALVKSLFGTSGIASTHLLYTRKYRIENLNKWNSELWECDYDGANARKVLDDQSGYCVTPIYIPPKPGYQSSMFFYVSYRKGQPKIYLGSLISGAGQQLTHLRGNQLMPAISPQRDKIAFISDITGNPDLFLQDFSPEKGPIGKPRQIFTTHQATQGSPTFSPDGKRIAFVSNKDGSPRIYVLDIPPPETKLKDIKARLISRINRESSAPCWSPDGTKLAFCARNGDDRQIWIYDFQRDEEWQLTESGGNKENPSWAPNSLHLFYNSTGKQNAELFLINLNDQRPIKILDEIRGEKRFPSWEPRL